LIFDEAELSEDGADGVSSDESDNESKENETEFKDFLAEPTEEELDEKVSHPADYDPYGDEDITPYLKLVSGAWRSKSNAGLGILGPRGVPDPITGDYDEDSDEEGIGIRAFTAKRYYSHKFH
jgi:hypothetical protein